LLGTQIPPNLRVVLRATYFVILSVAIPRSNPKSGFGAARAWFLQRWAFVRPRPCPFELARKPDQCRLVSEPSHELTPDR